ncbi:hypothetical protein OROMI_009858 [Orobanche minor]
MSSRKLKLEATEKLEENIVLLLCKLEMIFPPAFFEVMIHLAIHMPHEARLGGPVQHRWMYPFESHLGTLKGTVTNKAQPEGSIAEAFIMRESLTFCSQYLEGIETKFNRPDRYYDGEDQVEDRVSTFSHKIRPFGGAIDGTLSREEYCTMHWYVLNNTEEMRPYLIEHEELLLQIDPSNIIQRQKELFADWFRNKMNESQEPGEDTTNDDLKALAIGPDFRFSSFSGCIVNGVKYLFKKRDLRRKTQNSGVRVEGEHSDDFWEFYGVINRIIELRYRGNRKVHLFDCEWYDSRVLQIDRFFTSVNLKKKWYANEPYILAIQAAQVFYVRDTRLGKDWAVVQIVQHRHKWDKNLIPEHNEETRDFETEVGDPNDAYQQDTIANEMMDIDIDVT